MPYSTSKQTILAIHGSASSGRQWQSLQNLAHPSYNLLAPTIPETDAESRLKTIVDLIPQCSGPHPCRGAFVWGRDCFEAG